jgi:hypothetical protein
MVGNAIAEAGGRDAVAFKLAEKYVDAFGLMAQVSLSIVFVPKPNSQFSGCLFVYLIITALSWQCFVLPAASKLTYSCKRKEK